MEKTKYVCNRGRDVTSGDVIQTDTLYYKVKDLNKFLCVITRCDGVPYRGEMRWIVQIVDLVEITNE